MKKITIIFSFCILLFSGFSVANSDINKNKLVDFVLINNINPSIWNNNKVRHYCHMKTVYVERVLHGSADSLAIVWNHHKNTPLKCEDYNKYINDLLKK
jgi:hypothetical protein